MQKLCPDLTSPLYAARPMYVPGDGLLCPEQPWLDQLAPMLMRARGGTDLNLLNAGANKGFTAALLLQRFGIAVNFTNADWYRELTLYLKERHLPASMHICGVCCACLEPRPPRPVRHSRPRVRVHAFEPVKANFDFLAMMFPRFSSLKASASVVRAALGSHRNRTAAIAEHKGIVVGKENVAARLMDVAAPTERYFASVPIIVLDDWMARERIQHVDLALFDVRACHDTRLMRARALSPPSGTECSWRACSPPAPHVQLARASVSAPGVRADTAPPLDCLLVCASRHRRKAGMA